MAVCDRRTRERRGTTLGAAVLGELNTAFMAEVLSRDGGKRAGMAQGNVWLVCDC